MNKACIFLNINIFFFSIMSYFFVTRYCSDIIIHQKVGKRACKFWFPSYYSCKHYLVILVITLLTLYNLYYWINRTSNYVMIELLVRQHVLPFVWPTFYLQATYIFGKHIQTFCYNIQIYWWFFVLKFPISIKNLTFSSDIAKILIIIFGFSLAQRIIWRIWVLDWTPKNWNVVNT